MGQICVVVHIGKNNASYCHVAKLTFAEIHRSGSNSRPQLANHTLVSGYFVDNVFFHVYACVQEEVVKKYKAIALKNLSNLEKKLSENDDGKGYFVGETVSWIYMVVSVYGIGQV